MLKRNIKSVLWVTLLLCLGTLNANAQKRWFRTSALEFGLIGGFSHYSGELTPAYFDARGLKPSAGIITRYTPNSLVTFRLSAQYGKLEGDDKWSGETETQARNLNFQSDIWDFTGAAEFNFNYIDFRQKTGVIPYAFIGASVFKFNPKAVFNYNPNLQLSKYLGSSYDNLASRDGELVELQPLGTEGQETTEFNDRKRYALTQVAIPVGAGFKFKVSHNWMIGVEYGARITFTDYLDDVSDSYVDPSRLQAQYGPMSAAMSIRSETYDETKIEGSPRGDAKKNDMYGIFGVTIMYRIYGNKPACPTFL
jgi:hypothetical protein